EAESPVTVERFGGVTVPALVMAGGRSPEVLTAPARAVADVLPNAEYRVLPGQTHMVSPKVLGPVLAEFLAGADRRSGSGPARP
ncbi:MAG TPA: hypothetical protein VD813_04750, partial [Pseudonocardia sp.]|nr:hypothetical protein [Pseudonocardia sp.]